MARTSQSSKFSNTNQSTDKVLAILELLSCSEIPLRLIDIATELNLNTSTALRFLNSLEQNGYIYKDKQTLKYHMTFKLCGLASHISSHTDLVQVAAPQMEKLSHELRECVCLAIEQNYSVIYVNVSDGPNQILRTTQRIGIAAPMHCTGVGKVILSEFPMEKIDEMIALKGLEQYTEHTLSTKEDLLAELTVIRQRGYGYDNEECESGVRCIAFPIRNSSGRIVAALSVTGPLSRMTNQFIDANFRRILETVQDISIRLG
ncbi:MAG: IclR family transcriptional regulator [Lachnospiraceae bacterium]|nr:IclR family transcriptional regulator [Lachnospiraceae bacterium]